MRERYIVMTSSAKMPGTVQDRYINVAVVETDGTGERPEMISWRAKHVVRIVAFWERCHLGSNPQGNTEAERALRQAHEMAARLNAETRLLFQARRARLSARPAR